MNPTIFEEKLDQMKKVGKFIPLDLKEMRSLTKSQLNKLSRIKNNFVKSSTKFIKDLKKDHLTESKIGRLRNKLSATSSVLLVKELQLDLFEPLPGITSTANSTAPRSISNQYEGKLGDFGLPSIKSSLLDKWDLVIGWLGLLRTTKITKYDTQDKLRFWNRKSREVDSESQPNFGHSRKSGSGVLGTLLKILQFGIAGRILIGSLSLGRKLLSGLMFKLVPKLFGILSKSRLAAGLIAASKRIGLGAILARIAPGFLARQGVALATAPGTLGIGTVVLTILNVLITLGTIIWAMASPKLKSKISNSLSSFFTNLWLSVKDVGNRIFEMSMSLNKWMFSKLPDWVRDLVPEEIRREIEQPVDPEPTAESPKGDKPKATSSVSPQRYPEGDKMVRYGGVLYRTNYSEAMQAIKWGAQQLGVSAEDLGTVISYETGGTLSPDIKGGVGSAYLGLIQFSPDSQKKYGVTVGMTYAAQMKAVVAYLKDRGVKPGMSGIYIYSAINAGSANPKYWNRSDAGVGGRPGSVQWKYQNDMSKHRADISYMMGQPQGNVTKPIQVAKAKSQQTTSPTPLPAPTPKTRTVATTLPDSQTKGAAKVGSYTGPTINDGGTQIDEEDTTMAQALGAL